MPSGDASIDTKVRACAQDIDAAYLFQDMGDIDDDLSSLLVPDLNFASMASGPIVPPLPKMPQPVQTGAHPGTRLHLLGVLPHAHMLLCTGGIVSDAPVSREGWTCSL